MYETYVGYEFEVENRIKSLIDNSRHITNYEGSTIRAYHSTKDRSRTGLWRIEQDESLTNNGAEFISPVQKLEHSIETMKTFLTAIKENGSITSTRCGCHINMSLMYHGRIIKLDEDALLSNINWRLLFSLWKNRLLNLNPYCKNLSSIFRHMKQHRASRHKKISIKSGFGNEIFRNNHGFIVKKQSLTLKKGTYYELQFPGGLDYHKYPDKIETTVRHFDEILKKSRQTICNNKINKKIITYINRTQATDLPPSLLTAENMDKCLSIKAFANTYQPCIDLDFKVLTMARNIVTILMPPVTYGLTKRNTKKLKRLVCKNHLCYYFLKYSSVNCYKHSFFDDFNPLDYFRKAGVELTIPEEESDLDKLWLAKVYTQLDTKEQKHITNSIKSKKIKNIFNKMLNNEDYGIKIVNAQINKKRGKVHDYCAT